MPKYGSEEDYKRKMSSVGEDFGNLEDEEYVFEIIGYDTFEPSAPTKFNPEMYPSGRLFCKPIAYAQDEESQLLNSNGKPLHPEKTVYFWFNTNGSLDKARLGYGPSGPSLARRVIWAAFNTPIKQSLHFEWDDLIGKKFIGSTILEGEYEKIETARPYRGSTPSRTDTRTKRGQQTDLVAAAKDVFDGDTPF